MTDYSWEVHKAVVSALEAVSITGGRVYDHVPPKAVFPFTQVADSDVLTDDVSDPDNGSDGGLVETIDIHIWSRFRGQKEVKEEVQKAYDALHEKSLTVAGRSSALSWVRRHHALRDNDGLTYHVILSVEIQHRN